MPKLAAGIARANITPPVGMLMSGYASRKTPAEGTHDELYTVVLYLTDGDTEAALVTTDLISVSAEGTARIREACGAASGVPAENIVVAFAHNHGGPQTNLHHGDSGDELREAYGTVVVHKMAGALAEAKRNAVSVRMGYGRQDCHFGMNRREHRPDGTITIGFNPDGPTGHFTDVIRFDRLDTGDPLAIVFSYACHGTTMRADNLLYTADYSGLAKTFVDQQFPTALSAFVAFCSADIDPWPHGDFEKCERYGRELGCAVTQAALDISRVAEYEEKEGKYRSRVAEYEEKEGKYRSRVAEYEGKEGKYDEQMTEDVRIAVASQDFKLQLERIPSLEEALKTLAEAKSAADKEMDKNKSLNWVTERRLSGAEDLVKALENGETDFGVSGEIQALAIGNCAIVGMPGEIFVRIGLEIAEKSPFEHTIAIAHTNGSIGYVPTEDQVPLGGYEIERARARKHGIFIAPDSDQVLVDGSLAVLQKCHNMIN